MLNRGNGRRTVFHDEDEDAFCAGLLRSACAHVPLRLLAYGLLPNPVHLDWWPPGDDDLALGMPGLLTRHVARHRQRQRTTGPVWQGRFQALPMQVSEDEQLLTVLRSVERNPLRADLVARAEAWRWSSLRPPARTRAAALAASRAGPAW